jgi:hypothetical protein
MARRSAAGTKQPRMDAVTLDAFSDETFDAVAWVNGALSARSPEEPLDMHVGELLMRMQLLAQDVQYNLRDSSDLAMMNLPKSQREIELIQAEAGTLHAQTERLKQQLEASMHTSDGPRIALLGELDAVKLKAEGCVEKLNEAEKLDNLRLQVDNAFRSDDLAQMAQSLGAFRASLVRPSSHVSRAALPLPLLAALCFALPFCSPPHRSTAPRLTVAHSGWRSRNRPSWASCGRASCTRSSWRSGQRALRPRSFRC